MCEHRATPTSTTRSARRFALHDAELADAIGRRLLRGRVIVVIRRLLVSGATAAVLLALSACGREGGVAFPNNARFCKLASDLSAGAAARLGTLGPNPPLAKLAAELDVFVQSSAKEYDELNRVAVPYLRAAFARQRAAQRAFIDAQTDADRLQAYSALARNGAQLLVFEQRECRQTR